jgi:thymidylate synthase
MIPALCVTAKTLPEAWEQSVLVAWEQGAAIRTEYDRPDDPPSRDCTMMVVVEEPFTEPRIHRAFPGGLEDLEKYRAEVVEGVHDDWIAPAEGKWTYTYHQRLFAYGSRLAYFSPFKDSGQLAYVGDGETAPIAPVDQIEYVCRKLAEAPHSRRAQAVTWIPFADPATDDPPCLQRVWCRVWETRDESHEDEGGPVLVMNTHWRSRDAYKAAFMNMWALTDLQAQIAARVGELRGEEIAPGRYVDISDSYHIYGSYFDDFQMRFLRSVRERPYEERVWSTGFAREFFEIARQELAEEAQA